MLSVQCLSAVLFLLQAISLDFLGVPGSALGCATADLIAKHGFPQDKRLGAGIVDGRSVWADGDVPTALLGSLVKQVGVCADILLLNQTHRQQCFPDFLGPSI